MTSEVIIDAQPKEISIALLEGGCLVEYQREPREVSFSVGSIYVTKVEKLMPGLDACFADVGYERGAFLHYLDLRSQFNSYTKYPKQVRSDCKKLYPTQKTTRLPDLQEDGIAQDTLQVGREVVAQIIKEPASTKRPRLINEISFVGRFLVLILFEHKVSVSSRIKSGEERACLRQLIQSITPKNFGMIARTVAEGKRVTELDVEMKALLNRWDGAVTGLQKTQERPQLVFEEAGRVAAMLCDLSNPTYENTYVNDDEIRAVTRHYASLIAPEKVGIVEKHIGKVPIFGNSDVAKQIKSSFGKTINYDHDCHLIIERTEAVHVVDVNSGNRMKEKVQEQNVLDINLDAADELARQLRLRDMGGIIVVDFIDMNFTEDRQMLYERMCRSMQKGRIRHNILPLSKFGLMQIARQRVRPVMDVDVDENCPTCFGTGKVRSSVLFTDQLERRIDRLVNKVGIKKFYLHVHPYVAAYINKNLISLKCKWQMKYGLDVNITPSQKLIYLQYEFYDIEQQFINMKKQNNKL